MVEVAHERKDFKEVQSSPNHKAERKAAEQLFDSLDQNKDGFLDREEVEFFLKNLELETYEKDIVFKNFDSNRDSKLDRAEFVHLFQINALFNLEETILKNDQGDSCTPATCFGCACCICTMCLSWIPYLTWQYCVEIPKMKRSIALKLVTYQAKMKESTSNLNVGEKAGDGMEV